MENEQSTALTLPNEATFIRDITAINRFQQVVRSNMVSGQDYGTVPGTSKPTLLKPGAEKIAKLLGLADQYEILDRQEDWDKPFFRYLIKCSLNSVATGITISEGLGECNSMESKYRWRESKRKCPACGAEAIIKGKAEYGGGWLCFKKTGGCGAKWDDGAKEIESQSIGRIENDDIYSQVNTILKMSKKRALVDAALSAGRLSQVFTQDMEDLPPQTITVEPPQQPTTKTPPEATSAKATASKPETGMPVFKNGADLVNYAIKQGIKWDVIQEKLSISKPPEITDLDQATKILFGGKDEKGTGVDPEGLFE